MKNILMIIGVMTITAVTYGQVAEMNWELDYEIYLKMANDSNYTYDIRNAFHVTDTKTGEFSSEFVFYPVNPGSGFAQTLNADIDKDASYNTLWSALHAKLGGGWIHFVNCIAYSLETQALNLKEPIMIRPDSDWKPDPVTESWMRTKKWEYYIPVSQKNAKKELKIRLKQDEMGDLKNLPDSYLELFEATSDAKYEQMMKDGNLRDVAKIDIVKVMLGAKYLGSEQINYVSNAVLAAVQNYSTSKLPSVLIFDEYEAAAAMSLSAEGYQLESIVFRSSAELTDEEMESRKNEIIQILENINTYNQEAFRKRLGNYYLD